MSEQQQMRTTLLLISGIGALGLIMALVLFAGDLFGTNSSAEGPVTNVDASDFPLTEPEVAQIIDEEASGAVGVGQVAPNFTLVDLDGNTHSLDALRGQPVIINFWASWCAPCRIEMPELEATYDIYADDQLEILAVNREETPDIISAFFVDELNLSFPALLDSTAAVADGYGVFNMPTTYFVNADGVVTAVHRGPMTQEVIDGYMEQTLNSVDAVSMTTE